MQPAQFPVYMDYNATTPVDARVLEAMLPYFTQHFGNAASTNHAFGRRAAEAVQQAREEVAGLINAIPEEIVFTGGATESINLAIKGVFEMYASKGHHIITTQAEHSAVLDTCASLEKKGAAVTYLPVQRDGLVDLFELEKAITPQTMLISVMYANNETGVVQDVKAIGRIAKQKNILFFSDAAQAVGKIDVDVLRDDISLLSISAHKMYGPKGAGALYVRRKDPRVQLSPQMHGGKQEKGKRSGTLNVPGIVGLGAAANLCKQLMGDESARLSALRNSLEQQLLQYGAEVNGSTASRLPHVTNLSFGALPAQAMAAALYPHIAASSGSACATGTHEPSHVLKAMGISDEQAFAAVRLSLGRFTTEGDIRFTVEIMQRIAGELQEAGKH